MSKDVDRNQVFKTTRVRTALKNDGSWIQKSKQEQEEQNKTRTDQTVETRPALVRQKTYVLSTAKKFDDSANQANGNVTPVQKDAQSEGSTEETTDDTKLQATTEELIQNGEAQLEKIVANTAAENKDGYADTPIDESNVDHSNRVAEVYADVRVVKQVQNDEAQVSSTEENPEAVSPVELSEQQVATTTAESKGEYNDTSAKQSNVEQSEAKVLATADVENVVVETTDEEVPAVHAEELKPQEEPSIETENAAHLENAGVESTELPAEERCNKCLPEDSSEIFKAEAVVVEESLPDTNDVIHAAPGEEADLHNNVEPDTDLLAESVSESLTHCATETATEGSHVRCSPEQCTEEMVEAVAEVAVALSSETPAVTQNTKPRDVSSLQGTVEPIIDVVSKSPTAVETAVKPTESKEESAAPAEQKARDEDVAECEIQSVNNTVVEQNAEPAPQNSSDCVMELSIEDALEPAPEAGADKVCDRAIELTDALDVEPPTAETVPKPVEDTQQSHSGESKVNQAEETNITDMFEKPKEEIPPRHSLKVTSDGKAVCSFCDQVIDGNVKITLSEPLASYHPECLKCGVCAMILGDLLTPMFLHDQVIQCGGCFAKAVQA